MDQEQSVRLRTPHSLQEQFCPHEHVWGLLQPQVEPQVQAIVAVYIRSDRGDYSCKDIQLPSLGVERAVRANGG